MNIPDADIWPLYALIAILLLLLGKVGLEGLGRVRRLRPSEQGILYLIGIPTWIVLAAGLTIPIIGWAPVVVVLGALTITASLSAHNIVVRYLQDHDPDNDLPRLPGDIDDHA